MCTCSYYPASYAQVSCISWLVDVAFHILFTKSSICSSEYGMYISVIKCLQEWTGTGNLLNLQSRKLKRSFLLSLLSVQDAVFPVHITVYDAVKCSVM